MDDCRPQSEAGTATVGDALRWSQREPINWRRKARLFTPREVEVLFWIARGKTDWQAAEILMISAKTVNYHVERIKRKLDVATRTQAVLAAIEARLLEPPAGHAAVQ